MAELPEWVRRNHPNIVDVVHSLAQLLRSNVEAAAEVEFRLLRCAGAAENRWSSDIGFEAQDSFLSRCSDKSNATGGLVFGPWQDMTDYFYTIEGGAQCRTRVLYDLADFKVVPETVQKTLLERCDVKVGAECWALRLDAKEETAVPADALPRAVEPTRVALSQRCSALCPCSDGGDPLWRYDATLTWSATTRTEAEARQHSEGPVYQLELEYIGGGERLRQLGAVYVACSGLLKLLDVVGALRAPCSLRSSAASAPEPARAL